MKRLRSRTSSVQSHAATRGQAATWTWRRDEVAHDADRLNSVKYLFVLAAEVAIDAGQHVIAAEGLRSPASFAGVFDELGRAGWITEDLAASLGAMAAGRPVATPQPESTVPRLVGHRGRGAGV
jgi:uncharacterized protein YutE (UPF0331/DUF86 family)